MIELPADLAEVLTVVQLREDGTEIAFPDVDEDQLTELAEAWEAWTAAAEPRIQAIVACARQAVAHMSGEAADGFHRYLERYSGRDDAHAVTTLETGLAMAHCLRGASGTVARAKTTMVEQLWSTKHYLDSSLPGASPEVAAQSEGVRLTVDSCRHHVGQAGAEVDSMLRRSADRIERMDGAGQVCALGGTSTRDGGTAGAFASAEVPGRAGGSACPANGSATAGLSLAGFTGAVASADVPGAAPAADLAGASGAPGDSGGASSGALGAAAVGAGAVNGAAGRGPAVGGTAGRAGAGIMPSAAGAGPDARSRTVPGAGGQSTLQPTRQPLGSGAGSASGGRAGSGAATAGAGASGRGPVIGGMHGTGRAGGKKNTGGRRRPGLLTEEAPEQEEILTDSGIQGQAGDAPVRDRRAQQARQRWLDDARTGAAGERRAGAPQTPGEEEPPPEGDSDLLKQLTSVVLGPEPEGKGPAAASGPAGAGGAAAGQAEGRPAGDGAGVEQGRTATPRRRGEPDQGTGAGASAQTGAEAATKRAPLREEGGYQVPSPHLRAALAKLATSGAFDRSEPTSAPPRSSAVPQSPQQ
ncbi:WXG100-like domain-containing protein [Kitasatospora sp. NPDC001175]|uniref:WXG100-like domain-containing protein n=1 Tax=Kitasatospora sp. NPDC001175 TaxID=3157103 RepID=UPI003D035486